jgi:hypothetical protein
MRLGTPTVSTAEIRPLCSTDHTRRFIFNGHDVGQRGLLARSLRYMAATTIAGTTLAR